MSTTVLLHSIGFGITTAAVIAIGAMGFTLQLGVTNVLNLSFGNVMTIGAFAALIVERWHLGLLATIIAAPLAGAVVTIVLARTLFAMYARRRGGAFDLLMVTLAVGLILQYGIDALAHLQVFQFSFPSGATLNVGPFVFTIVSLALI